MTPLPWWVLLATLLGRAIGVPVHGADDACVPLCRERHDGPLELCNADDPVLQYDGRHVGARSALGLCLAPCAVAPEDLRARSYLEDLHICRALRDVVVQLQGCDCANADRSHGKSASDYRDVLESADEELREFLRDLRTSGVTGLEEKARVQESSKLSLDRPAFDAMNGKPSKYRIRGASLESGSGSRNVGGLAATTTEASSSEEEPVDWDMWCMAQCDNGQGGSACKCDIIP